MSMTPEEFEKQMLKLQKNGDEEERHMKMDNLICKLLIKLGYEEGINIFKNTKKWYA